MYSFNRGGPGRRTATPANVQCQKCLKRGHYSYECKEKLQERPYIARPSRTQMLRNPKLAPKLAGDEPNPLKNKKGVADEELAKREAERARQKSFEDDGDDDAEPESSHQQRGRSPSVDSYSSTSSRSRSPTPRHSPALSNQQRSRNAREVSPQPRAPSPRGNYRRSRSFDSADERDSRRSSDSPGKEPRGNSRRERSFSLSRSPSRPRSLTRSPSPVQDRRQGSRDRGYRRQDTDSKERAPRRRGHTPPARSPSRSPARTPEPDRRNYRVRDDPDYGRDGNGRDNRRRRYQDDYDRRPPRRSASPRRDPPQRRAPAPAPLPPRERSLSPFSKRLAMTQAMNARR